MFDVNKLFKTLFSNVIQFLKTCPACHIYLTLEIFLKSNVKRKDTVKMFFKESTFLMISKIYQKNQ